MSNYPFYKGGIEAAKQIAPGQTKTANTGLWFTRFYSGFEADWSVGDEGKRGWIDKTVGLGASGGADQVTHLLERQRQLCLALGGQVACLQSIGNFVTGTGLSHPVENGFAFHPTLGMPYLPASGVKGLLRGWVEVWMDHHGNPDKDVLITRWFGAAKGGDQDAQNTSAAEAENAGGYIFFDALPSKPVHLGCDVMTPHMGKWYEKGGDYTAAMQASAAPADWHSPVPVPFLVVKSGTEFNFMVAPRATGNAETDAVALAELPRVMTELKNALEWLGAGAKTAVGYGRMVDQRAQDEQQRTEGLAKLGIQMGEEVWEKAILFYEKGSRTLYAGMAGKKNTAPWTGDKAKAWVDARSKSEVKKLEDRKLIRQVRVSIQGSQVTLLSIDDPA
jgi:CRISPR-associated protein Cmr6